MLRFRDYPELSADFLARHRMDDPRFEPWLMAWYDAPVAEDFWLRAPEDSLFDTDKETFRVFVARSWSMGRLLFERFPVDKIGQTVRSLASQFKIPTRPERGERMAWDAVATLFDEVFEPFADDALGHLSEPSTELGGALYMFWDVVGVAARGRRPRRGARPFSASSPMVSPPPRRRSKSPLSTGSARSQPWNGEGAVVLPEAVRLAQRFAEGGTTARPELRDYARRARDGNRPLDQRAGTRRARERRQLASAVLPDLVVHQDHSFGARAVGPAAGRTRRGSRGLPVRARSRSVKVSTTRVPPGARARAIVSNGGQVTEGGHEVEQTFGKGIARGVQEAKVEGDAVQRRQGVGAGEGVGQVVDGGHPPAREREGRGVAPGAAAEIERAPWGQVPRQAGRGRPEAGRRGFWERGHEARGASVGDEPRDGPRSARRVGHVDRNPRRWQGVDEIRDPFHGKRTGIEEPFPSAFLLRNHLEGRGRLARGGPPDRRGRGRRSRAAPGGRGRTAESSFTLDSDDV